MSDFGPNAIPTEYAGQTFRSRLEARWALFMDRAGVAWEYEPEGFDLGGIRYLPDFWLGEHGCWAEVKASGSKEPDEARAIVDRVAGLADETQKPVFLLLGSPDRRAEVAAVLPKTPERRGEMRVEVSWAACLTCGAIGMTDGSDELPLPCGHRAIGTNPRLAQALDEARTHRFWTGRP